LLIRFSKPSTQFQNNRHNLLPTHSILSSDDENAILEKCYILPNSNMPPGLRASMEVTLLHKSSDMYFVKHKLVKNSLPTHHAKHDETEVPPKCRRAGKQAVSRHLVWLNLSLKRVLPVEFVGLSPYFRKYTRRVERHAWALLKRSYQAVYCSVIHITIFGGLVARGLEAWMPCSTREVWFAGV
jgi:hypothetical protein